MSHKGYRTLCLTYNIAQTSGKGAKSLKSWFPVEERGPDFVAIGLQEIAPLWFALLGLSGSVLSAYEKAIKEALAKDKVSYKTLVKQAKGGNGLIVLVREGSPSRAVAEVQTSSAAFGVVFMANKGAIGARIGLTGERGEEQPSLTFVTGHLAAHEHKLARRNADWREVVGRVLFATAQGAKQIYDTSCLFVLGDLNYRIVAKRGMNVLHKLHNDMDSLLPLDQLTKEIEAGRTLQHLHEGAIAFKPTYKMLKGELDNYKTKRTPSWCDRILYTTFDTKHTRLRNYTSHPGAIASDHKPVSALFSLPPIEGRSLRLRHPAPYAPDGMALPKALLGGLLDTIVGIIWLTVAMLGGGKDKIGAVNAVLLLGALWYYQSR